MAIEQLALSKLRIDGGTQQRAKIDLEVVADYAERFDSLPAVTVFFDGTDYWLGGGFHRYHAAAKLERKKFGCEVRKGTLREAILFSVGDNASHGLRRTIKDKRKAVWTLLADPEWGQKSDRWIAEVCVVSHTFVSELRAEYEFEKRNSTGNVASSPGKLGKDGKVRSGKESDEEKVKKAADKAAKKKAADEQRERDKQAKAAEKERAAAQRKADAEAKRAADKQAKEDAKAAKLAEKEAKKAAELKAKEDAKVANDGGWEKSEAGPPIKKIEDAIGKIARDHYSLVLRILGKDTPEVVALHNALNSVTTALAGLKRKVRAK